MGCARVTPPTAVPFVAALLAVLCVLQAFAAAASTSDSNYLYRALHEGDKKDLRTHGEIRAAGRTQVGLIKNKCSECSDPKNCATCHVGNYAVFPSNFISTTTSPDVAKEYASEKSGKIAVIDRTKLPAGKVKDLSTLRGRLDHLGSTYSSRKTDLGPDDKSRPGGIKDPRRSTHQEVRNRAHLFAKHSKEVLVEGSIPKDCIVEVTDAGNLRRRAGGGGSCRRRSSGASSIAKAASSLVASKRRKNLRTFAAAAAAAALTILSRVASSAARIFDWFSRRLHAPARRKDDDDDDDEDDGHYHDDEVTAVATVGSNCKFWSQHAFVTAIAVALSFTKSSAASFSTADSATYAVTSLPFSSAATINGQYAGYIPAPTSTDSAAQLFYWYLPSTNATSQELVIWLNGGPGCSSLIGLFEENGPVLFQNDSTTAENKYSWNAVASMLYVDQPVGAGFSTGDTVPSTADEVVATFLSFLDNFYKVFPALKSYNLYITGESFAGFFIPNIAYGLVKNPQLSDGSLVKLKGISVSNGLYDTANQKSFQSTINDVDYLRDSNFFGADTAALAKAGAMAQKCLYATQQNVSGISYQCDMTAYVQRWEAANNVDKCVYEIDQPCNYLAGAAKARATFLNKKSTQSAIHVASGSSWTGCGGGLSALRNDPTPEARTIIPKLVDAGVPVLLLDGDRDFVFHYVGAERAIGNMTWSSPLTLTPPLSAATLTWPPSFATPAGSLHTAGDRFAYIRVAKTGHKVPDNQPAAAQEALRYLIGMRATYVPTGTGGGGGTTATTIARASGSRGGLAGVWAGTWAAGGAVVVVVVKQSMSSSPPSSPSPSAAAVKRIVSLAPISTITASTTNDDPVACPTAAGECAPQNVASAQNDTGFLDYDAARWMSKPAPAHSTTRPTMSSSSSLSSPRDVSLAPLSVVTANTTSDDPATCAVGKNGCAPENVANAQNATGFLDADATRWVSKAYYFDTYEECNSEWLQFKFPENRNFVLKNISIDYGFLSWKFEGTLNFWPDLFVADAAGGPLKRLSMPSVTTTVTSRINHQYQINDRLDILEISSSYVVQANVSADGVKELRILWSLIPQGDGPPYLCQMDVFEVLINAVEYVPNGNGAENSGAASASTLSVGAIVGIVLAGVVAVALSALLLVRRHNVKKRETNALPIGDKVLVQSS
ncbi:serine carboxypeptidase-domain-containing protein [Zopfochytrium polystomum]|nr:serine carboxypeptidase-domain-containing protein [Zopfochytrium polystomum]